MFNRYGCRIYNKIMEKIKNITNSGDPKTVKVGETILIRATVDKTGLGMFMEFGSIIQKRNDIRGIFNKHRKNGYVPGLRRAWEPTTMEDINDELGIDLLELETEIDDKGREFYTLNILNPIAYNYDANELQYMCLQVDETTIPTRDQQNNWRKKAKRVNDEYFKCDGKLIFANTSIVFGKPVHTLLKHDIPDYITMDETIIIGDEPDVMEDTELEGSFLD